MNLYEIIFFNKVATISAGLFYLFLILVLLIPNLRKTTLKILILPTPSTNIQIASLDSFRGIAAALVALAHIWYFCQPLFNDTQQIWFPSLAVAGNKAVPIFVVLSGFLIYKAVKNIKDMQDLSRYVTRRFLRIYPVYIFSVILGFSVGQVSFDLSNFLSNIFMVRAINPAHLLFVNPPAWSLYVEILFYMILPIWVIAFRQRIIVASIISFIVLLWADSLGSRELWLWKYFFMGVFISEISDYCNKKISEKMAILLFVAGLILLYIDFHVWKHPKFDWFNLLHLVPKNAAEYSIGLGIGCMLVIIGSMFSRKVTSVMGLIPLRILGSISYSLYLIHPFYILAVFPKLQFSFIGKGLQDLGYPIAKLPAWYMPFVMFAGCLLWSIVCYILIERPFLLLRPGHKIKDDNTQLIKNTVVALG